MKKSVQFLLLFLMCISASWTLGVGRSRADRLV